MKHMPLAVLVALLVPVTSWAGDVGVSLTVGQPGFYGHIDIGDYPRPEVVYAQPVVIQPVPAGVVVQPVYLHVPPGQEKKWGHYCASYSACGRPVYFVQDVWYNNVYVPEYGKKHGRGHGGGPGNGYGHGRGKGRH